MKKNIFLFSLCVLFLVSCSPKIITNISQQRTPLANNAEVKILQNYEKLPKFAAKLGTVKITDSGFSVNCGYDVVIEHIKAEARKAGGNIVQIIEHFEPDFHSTCHRITADVYRFDNLSLKEFDDETLYAEVSKSDSVDFTEQLVIKGRIGIYDNISGVKLTNSGIRSKLANYPDALKTFNSGISARNGANVLGYIGGFCVGWGVGAMLGSVVFGGEIQSYNYYIMAAGGAFIIPAIIVDVSGKNKIKKAVNMYNFAQQQNSFSQNNVKVSFGLTANGAGVIVNF